MDAGISGLFHCWAGDWLILALFETIVVDLVNALPILQSAPGGSRASLNARIFYTPEEVFSQIVPVFFDQDTN